MEKEPRLLIYGAARITCLLLLIAHLLYTEFSALQATQIVQWKQHLPNWNGSLSTIKVHEVNVTVEDLTDINLPRKVDAVNVTVEGVTHLNLPRNVDEAEEHDSQRFLLARLVEGEHRTHLESTGVACDSTLHSLVCVVNRPVKIDTNKSTVHVSSDQNILPQGKKVVRPYARQEDESLLKYVTPVQILHENTTSPACHYSHDVPAVIFSSSGFTGNLFHEFNEIIIPLFITSRHFQSNVQFILTDYKPSFVSRYSRIFSRLSRYEIMNPAANGSVHCFPGVVVGLKFHNFLGINSSDTPRGYSMLDFKQFLRGSYNLKAKIGISSDTESRPTLMLISRQNSRMFLNEKQMVAMMKRLGFRVIVVKPKRMSNSTKFAKLVSSCNVMVGAHGAGLANELFLPAGAVMVQVVPLGLNWASRAYFGDPASDMGVHYLEYKIEPEESSLIHSYKRDDPIIADPGLILYKDYQAGRALYIDGQNMKINLARFRQTLVEALKILRTY